MGFWVRGCKDDDLAGMAVPRQRSLETQSRVLGYGLEDWGLRIRVHALSLMAQSFGVGAAGAMTLQEWRFRDSNDAKRWVHREHAHRLESLGFGVWLGCEV